MNFPEDKNTLLLDDQFMMGEAVLISPVLEQGAVSVDAYFPQGLWYDFNDWAFAYNVTSPDGMWASLHTPLTSVNVHIHGGTVLPLQQEAMTTTASRVTPFTLFVALCPHGKATGSLYWDDGENLMESEYFLAAYAAQVSDIGSGEVSGTVEISTYAEAADRRIDTIVLLWSPGKISGACNIQLNGVSQDFATDLDDTKGRLTFYDLNIKLTDSFSLTWSGP